MRETLRYRLWTADGVQFRPIETKNDHLAIHILTSLVAQGYTGDELVAQFRKAQDELIGYYESTCG